MNSNIVAKFGEKPQWTYSLTADSNRIFMLITGIETIIVWARISSTSTYVQNIMQPFFVGPFDVVGPRHLPTMYYAYAIVSCDVCDGGKVGVPNLMMF